MHMKRENQEIDSVQRFDRYSTCPRMVVYAVGRGGMGGAWFIGWIIVPDDRRRSFWSFFVSMKSFTANGSEFCRRTRRPRWYHHQTPTLTSSMTNSRPNANETKKRPLNSQFQPCLFDDDEKGQNIEWLNGKTNMNALIRYQNFSCQYLVELSAEAMIDVVFVSRISLPRTSVDIFSSSWKLCRIKRIPIVIAYNDTTRSTRSLV